MMSKNKTFLLFAIIFIFSFSLIASASAVELVVTRFTDDSISYLDVYSGETQKIKVGEGPNKIAVTPDKKLAVVTNTNDDSISIVDLEKFKQIKKIKVGKEPIGVEITPDGKEAYVANSKSNKIYVIDLKELVSAGSIEVGEIPIAIAFTKERAYVSNLADSSIDVIDRETKTVLETVQAPNVMISPGDITISNDGKTAYVIDTKQNRIASLDLETNKFLPSYIETKNTNINNELFVGNRLALLSTNGKEDDAAIQIIDFGKNEITFSIPVEGETFGMDFVNEVLVVVKEEGIEMIDIVNNERNLVPIGDKPKDVVILSAEKLKDSPPAVDDKKDDGVERKSPIKVIIVVIIIFIILIILFRGKGDEPRKKKAKKKQDLEKEEEPKEEKQEKVQEKQEKAVQKAEKKQEPEEEKPKAEKQKEEPKESKQKEEKKKVAKKRGRPKKKDSEKKNPAKKKKQTLKKEKAEVKKEPKISIEKIKEPEKPARRRKKYKVQKTKNFVDELLEEDLEKQNMNQYKQDEF
jgi:YVTN family beta-propeller protein